MSAPYLASSYPCTPRYLALNYAEALRADLQNRSIRFIYG
jgi:hypothetical protein